MDLVSASLTLHIHAADAVVWVILGNIGCQGPSANVSRLIRVRSIPSPSC